MSLYAITIETKNRIVVDEAKARDEKDAIAIVKQKHCVEEVRCCIISLVKESV